MDDGGVGRGGGGGGGEVRTKELFLFEKSQSEGPDRG